MKLDEYWVTIDTLPNYAVSNYGRVLNVRTGRERKVVKDKNGYLKIQLHHKGLRYFAYVHRLVARAFFLNYEEGRAVGFINGNKEDCTVLNLTLTERGCPKGEVPLW